MLTEWTCDRKGASNTWLKSSLFLQYTVLYKKNEVCSEIITWSIISYSLPPFFLPSFVFLSLYFFLFLLFFLFFFPPPSLSASLCLFFFFFFLKQCFTIYSMMVWNSLCRPHWPQTHRAPSASTISELGFKVCNITLGLWVPIFKCVVLVVWIIYLNLTMVFFKYGYSKFNIFHI